MIFPVTLMLMFFTPNAIRFALDLHRKVYTGLFHDNISLQRCSVLLFGSAYGINMESDKAAIKRLRTKAISEVIRFTSLLKGERSNSLPSSIGVFKSALIRIPAMPLAGQKIMRCFPLNKIFNQSRSIGE